jgi:hypothetical protein
VFVVKAADYTLASGQTETISASATYDAMSVNGALTLANGAKSTIVTATSLTVGGDAEHGYGSVTLGELPRLAAYHVVIDEVPGLASSDPVTWLTLQNGGTLGSKTCTNKSGRVARIDCYGTSVMSRGDSEGSSKRAFNYGDFEVVLNSGATLRIRHNFADSGNSYMVSPGDATLRITGQGDMSFESRWPSRPADRHYGLNFAEGLNFDFDGDINLIPYESNRKPGYAFRQGVVIGSTVKTIKSVWTSSWYDSGARVDIVLLDDVLLTVPSVDLCQNGVTLTGMAGSMMIVDARTEARTFKANIPSGDALTVCATGTCEVVVSSTTNISHLVVAPDSCVRFTAGDCTVEDLVIGENARVIADGCEVVLADGFATEGKSISQAYQTVNGGKFATSADGVTTIFGPSSSLTGFHFAAGSNVFSRVGIDKKYWRFTFMKTASNVLSLRGLYLFDENGTWINELGDADTYYASPATEKSYSVLGDGEYRFYCNSETNVTRDASVSSESKLGRKALHHVFSFDDDAESFWFPQLASPVLNENDPISWLSVEFALTNGHELATGYNLRYYDRKGYMQTWKVYASDDCDNWEEVDARRDQTSAVASGNSRTMDGTIFVKGDRSSLGAEYYTFTGYRTDGLAQTDPFTLQVDPGAVADLRAYTGGCVVSNLTIAADGAVDGVIYGAKLAESGTVNIILTEGDLPQCLPLRLPDVLNSENLGNWQVYVNGTPTNKKLFVLNGAVMLRQNGLVIIVQ